VNWPHNHTCGARAVPCGILDINVYGSLLVQRKKTEKHKKKNLTWKKGKSISGLKTNYAPRR
jgi:hypothetical protein